MIINHNMQALNAHRQMGTNATNAQKSMEKLSSGLRINRAGDDAAGLAISEKMRGQIRGLDQAGRNAQDGISLIQTAEGALNETHSILQRMRELGVQSANDTNTEADRAELQKEIDQLTEEIDRIATTTEFNTQKLLQGDGGKALDKTNVLNSVTHTPGTTTHTQATATISVTDNKDINAGDKLNITIGGKDISIELKAEAAATGSNVKVGADIAAKLTEAISKDDTLKGQFTVTDNADGTVTIKAVKDGNFDGTKGVISAATSTNTDITGGSGVGTTTHTSAKATIDLTSAFKNGGADLTGTDLEDRIKELVGKGLEIGGQQIEFYNVNDGAYKGDAIGVDISRVLEAADATNAETALADTIATQIGDKLTGVTVASDGAGNLTVTSKEVGPNSEVKIKDGATKEKYEIALQVGANAGQSMKMSIGDMRSDALGVSKIDVTSAEGATESITKIDNATAIVSSQRSQLGAFQNRLEHTINNLGTSSENLTAAESRVRDVDMAKEMMTMSKNNILNQAAQAMLAQANQAPQQVLQLLR